MGILCGIDEAGYGPRLGPLVVSAAVFSLDGSGPAQDRSEPVQKAISRVACDRPGVAGRLVVCDSKKLYCGPRRLERLERNLLPFVAAWREDFAGVFADACYGSGDARQPWYGECSVAVPRCGEAAGIAGDGAHVRQALEAEGVAPLGFWWRALDAAEFNEAVDRQGNKADVLFGVVAELLARLWRQADGRRVEVWVDKQGGRNRYAPLLSGLFPEAWVTVLAEGRERSVYEVGHGGRRMKVLFLCRGESAHRAVALASMCSKYVRELFMARFNAWWQRRLPGLKPTEGYAADAARFLREVAPWCRSAGLPGEILVRCR